MAKQLKQSIRNVSLCGRMRSPHLPADVLGLLGELLGVFLLVLTHPPIYLLALHPLLATTERRLALDHLEDQATQPPPVRAEGVALILDHLWGCPKVTSQRS